MQRVCITVPTAVVTDSANVPRAAVLCGNQTVNLLVARCGVPSIDIFERQECRWSGYRLRTRRRRWTRERIWFPVGSNESGEVALHHLQSSARIAKSVDPLTGP